MEQEVCCGGLFSPVMGPDRMQQQPGSLSRSPAAAGGPYPLLSPLLAHAGMDISRSCLTWFEMIYFFFRYTKEPLI